ncbi:MAG: glycoside hydrolase family 3 protein [Bradyrhizobiaceae bacterium]|nr:glycoside hydrolase family 3 protein [Bradyrhizobiaceae bacterium]
MVTRLTRRDFGKVAGAVTFGTSTINSALTFAQDASPDGRARITEQQMTDDERFSLLISVMGRNTFNPVRDKRIPDEVPMSAGYTRGVPRLAVPPLLETDASLGITNPGYRPGDTATALPASVMLSATFNPLLAREAGQMLGREARARGFNVLLAGGINLARDPRNGRNFEYFSEDPLVSAIFGSEVVNGAQSEGVISTLKHYSLNCNETNRQSLDAIIDPAAHRESDLLAFQIAIERSQPGAIMSAYNKVNGVYASGNNELLNEVLKKAWEYPGWVMSDWGAVHSWDYALEGLDQESGVQLDGAMNGGEWFTEPLRKAYADGKLPKERLSDMVCRILRSMYAVGVDRERPAPTADMAKHNAVALETARQGIVLLKNDGVLPLSTDTTGSIGVIGGYAHLGVPTGTGSSAVVPPGGYAAVIRLGGPGFVEASRNLHLLPSSPLEELRKLLPKAHVEYDPGRSPAEATLLARRCDVAIVFAIRVEGEAFDLADLSLPWGQDAVIAAVAAANANTIVVLETGNPVAMPWRDRVRSIVHAWYPGQAGGEAIADVLAGKINPSGRLPVTFPADLAQTPRPELPGLGTPGTPTTIHYDEGAEVGYRWFARKGEKPLYAFGHGLSYTSFAYRDLEVRGGDTVTVTVTVTNTGAREGADVPQVYLTEAVGDKRMRLLGFQRVSLEPGESKRVTVTADPRLLARFDRHAGRWRIAEGRYRVAVGRSAEDLSLHADTQLEMRLFGV